MFESIDKLKIQVSPNKSFIDPFALKRLSKFNPCRLTWTGWSRLAESYARATYKPLHSEAERLRVPHIYAERGEAIPDTAVTHYQSELLQLAVRETNDFSEPIIEVGSYRGVTTLRIARATSRTVYAVDPFIGYGASETDCEMFRHKIQSSTNIEHLRATSGVAFEKMRDTRLSLAFIDAVHDYSNSWFDFICWSSLVEPRGMIALHDVDDFPGTNLVARKIIADTKNFRFWGYCPNMAVFQKSSNQEDNERVLHK